MKNVMLSSGIAIVLCCVPVITNAQTNLNAGDLAVTGFGSDNPDDFHFVLLTDIEAGTVIRFTDSGVKSDGTFRGNEGAVSYTAPEALNAGTVIGYISNSADFTADNDATVGNRGLSLATEGDQLIAFQGSSDNPSFIFAFQSNSTAWQADATSSNTSALPPGLTNGLNAIAAGSGPGEGDEYDNARYDMSVNHGPADYILEAIADKANWEGNNTGYSPPSGSFDIGPDDRSPGIADLCPGNGAVDISPDAVPLISFDEKVYAGSGNVIIRNEDSSIFECFDIAEEGTGQGLLISEDNCSLQITPASPFSEGVSYYIEMDEGVLNDYFSNPFAGIAGEDVWSFEISLATDIHSGFARNIKIYPIPAGEELVIEDIGNARKIELYNMRGIMIKSVTVKGMNIFRLPLTGLPPGVYILKIYPAEAQRDPGPVTKKFVRQ